VVSELRRFQYSAGIVLAVMLVALTAGFLLSGHARAVSGLLAGGGLGFINLTWMVSTATRLMGKTTSARGLQAIAVTRFFIVAALLGAILIVGHVHPIAAVIGYGLFPLASAAAGWRFMSVPVGVRS
jgi:hypothetical protein